MKKLTSIFISLALLALFGACAKTPSQKQAEEAQEINKKLDKDIKNLKTKVDQSKKFSDLSSDQAKTVVDVVLSLVKPASNIACVSLGIIAEKTQKRDCEETVTDCLKKAEKKLPSEKELRSKTEEGLKNFTGKIEDVIECLSFGADALQTINSNLTCSSTDKDMKDLENKFMQKHPDVMKKVEKCKSINNM